MAPPPGLPRRRKHRVRLRTLARVASIAVGIQFGWALQLSLLTPYVQELGIPHAWASYIWLCGPISGMIAQPLIGVWSDSCSASWGRRRPFIAAGATMVSAAVLVIGFSADLGALLGDPRGPTASTGPKWKAVVIFVLGFWLLDLANNTLQGPCRALLGDFTGTEGKRTRRANAYFSAFMAAGNILGFAAGAYPDLHALLPFPFVLTDACDEACANLKCAFLLHVAVLACFTALSVTAAREQTLEELALLKQRYAMEEDSLGKSSKGNAMAKENPMANARLTFVLFCANLLRKAPLNAVDGLNPRPFASAVDVLRWPRGRRAELIPDPLPPSLTSVLLPSDDTTGLLPTSSEGSGTYGTFRQSGAALGGSDKGQGQGPLPDTYQRTASLNEGDAVPVAPGSVGLDPSAGRADGNAGWGGVGRHLPGWLKAGPLSWLFRASGQSAEEEEEEDGEGEEDEEEEGERQGPSWLPLWELVSSLSQLSPALVRVLLVTGLTWTSLFPFLLFDTDWMGREVFRGAPDGSDAQSVSLYYLGVHWGAFGLMLNSAVQGLASLLIDPAVRRVGSRVVWAAGNAILAMCLLGTWIVDALVVGAAPSNAPPAAALSLALAIFAALGLPLAVAYSIPYSLAATSTSAQGGGQGAAMGVLNLAVVLPQIVVSIASGPLDAAFGGGNLPAFLAACLTAAAGSLAAFFFIPPPPPEGGFHQLTRTSSSPFP